ncbi:MAG TPA: flagellar export chaperone FlgN [Dongiaceae bacterium]|nr:flagellar export chaperone FlgN [Dongiaceae bacterium]
MNTNPTYLELLEQRIELLNSLSATLLAARAAMTAFDVGSLEARINEQQELCGEIQKLDEQRERLQYQCAAHLRMHGGDRSLPNSPELEETMHRLYQAQTTVKQLNAAHQVLLQRSRRTVTALLNSIHTFEGSYRRAALQQTAARAEPPEKV